MSIPHSLKVLMRSIADSIGGLWELVWLAVKTRFRLRGQYWQWRQETVFGGDPSSPLSRWDRFRVMLAYGRWVYRMKRLR